mmetsp:Transcript_117871/g.328318  ORF Transcript_117871/g.328318 Transcript_117871/m.328318 type:complete len:384 (+) Transcript_117871:35-1186(+)|eukprot:CAMPEP_0179117436 /NCGR_PEP_ID=MMETSP0796-20121207/55159_1 /TAXON_ID=73915 /ORGANISM="Pyrodinium bahamense, Strain pbaha01" /LENGTH=383 /DNA_ID=CAMNT_0020815807 /DNA_START=35 /DNA_END=1186 /DNA_ORIENTATION=+
MPAAPKPLSAVHEGVAVDQSASPAASTETQLTPPVRGPSPALPGTVAEGPAAVTPAPIPRARFAALGCAADAASHAHSPQPQTTAASCNAGISAPVRALTAGDALNGKAGSAPEHGVAADFPGPAVELPAGAAGLGEVTSSTNGCGGTPDRLCVPLGGLAADPGSKARAGLRCRSPRTDSEGAILTSNGRLPRRGGTGQTAGGNASLIGIAETAVPGECLKVVTSRGVLPRRSTTGRTAGGNASVDFGDASQPGGPVEVLTARGVLPRRGGSGRSPGGVSSIALGHGYPDQVQSARASGRAHPSGTSSFSPAAASPRAADGHGVVVLVAAAGRMPRRGGTGQPVGGASTVPLGSGCTTQAPVVRMGSLRTPPGGVSSLTLGWE